MAHLEPEDVSPEDFPALAVRPVIVSGSADAAVRVWDLESGRQLYEPFVGHHGNVNAIAVGEARVRVWDLDIGGPLGSARGRCRAQRGGHPAPPPSSRRADGVVIDLETRSTSDGGTVFHPVVRFVTAREQIIVFTSNVGTSPPAHRIGDSVKVRYDLDNPCHARLDSGSDLIRTASRHGFEAVQARTGYRSGVHVPSRRATLVLVATSNWSLKRWWSSSGVRRLARRLGRAIAVRLAMLA
jgi:hypothetical protein